MIEHMPKKGGKTMSRQEILTKAVQKAITNGYVFPRKSWEITEELHIKLLTDKDFGNAVIADHYTIIFNHDFAKALWGESMLHDMIVRDYSRSDKIFVPWVADELFLPPNNWQFHLQQMVIADDPIAYLAEHL